MAAIFLVAALTQEAKAQPVSFENIRVQSVAVDSPLVNSTTNQSKTFILTRKSDRPSTSINSMAGANVLVMAKQTNDSVNAVVNLLVGRITGGTSKKTYATIFLDSLYTGHSNITVSLANYLTYPEIAIQVVGKSAGNGFVPKWNAVATSVGYEIKGAPTNSP